MPQFSAKRQLPHAAAQMFDLVADLEKYPEFVPLCAAMRLRSRQDKDRDKDQDKDRDKDRDKDKGTAVVVADMTVAYKLLRQTFTSRVTLDRPNLQILVDYLSGPFSHMRTRWAFHPAGNDACEVEFFTDYEFRSRALAALMGVMFETVFRRMVSAFESRAAAIYGRRSP